MNSFPPPEPPTSVHSEAAWQELEQVFDHYEVILQKLPAAERPPVMREQLEQLNEYLQRADMCIAGQIFAHVSSHTHDEGCEETVWQWLREIACTITTEQQFVALVIGALEPATEDPITDTDIDGLMRFLDDDRASRAVFCAYERPGFPADLFRHHGEYAVRCRKRGEVPVPMNLTALARWLHGS